MSIDMNKPDAGDTVTMAPVTHTAYQIPRVNLLPPEIAAERTFRTTQVVCGATVLGVVGLLAGGYLLSVLGADRAADALAAEQTVSQELTTEKGRYVRVTEVRNEVDAVRGARQVAMRQDILWAPQLDQIVTEMPPDMTFRSLTLAVDETENAADATNPLADPNAIGSFQFEAVGTNHSTAAAWLESQATHPGFVDPYLTQSSYADDNGRVQTVFTSHLKFTPELYSGRFDPDGSQAVDAGKGD